MAPEENKPNPGAQPGTGDGPGPNAGNPVQFTPEQQAHLDAIIAERLKRGREKWEADAAELARKAAAATEAAQLAEQQKWQELAQKREGTIGELEGKLKAAGEREGRLTRLEAALKAQLESQRAGLPPHVLALLDRLPVEEQLEYIAANAAALKPGQAVTIQPTPTAASPAGLTEEQRRAGSASVRSYW